MSVRKKDEAVGHHHCRSLHGDGREEWKKINRQKVVGKEVCVPELGYEVGRRRTSGPQEAG